MEIGDEDNYTYEQSKGAWVVWDNNPSTAETIKQLHPYDIVLLYNPDTKQYTRYYHEYEHKTFTMTDGEMRITTTTEKI